MQHGLEVCKLCKRIGRRDILNEVDFTVGEGEIVGLVGKNGAGKSSTLKCVSGFWKPTSGRVLIFGARAGERDALKNTAALVEYPALFPEETLESNIAFFSSFYGMDCMEEAEKLSALLDLNGAKNKKVKQFSSGMRQKACLLIVLMKRPRLLVLDEPTSMLDPVSASQIRTFLAERNREDGVSILISSHNLAELETLCARAIVIDGGRIRREISLTGERKKRYVLTFGQESEAKALCEKVFGSKQTGNTFTAELTASEFKEICRRFDPDYIDLSVGGDLELAYLSEE